jgi:serine/threonine-protein kinase HipA
VELDIWLGDQLVARTATISRGAKVRIVYDASIADFCGPEVPLLSCSLPTPGPSEPSMARAFLEGLLPEGRALAAAAARVRGVRLTRDGAPETPTDAVALLAEYGRECAGAVIIAPQGSPAPSGGRYLPHTDEGLASAIRDLPRKPLGADPERGIRMSLGGAQDKLLLARIDGVWNEPLDGAPSTHIIKPATAWPNSAQNEALVLELARAARLTNSASWVEEIGGTTALVAERYDRRIVDGRIARVHQEDMCQALGIRPQDKYEIGRPSERMAKILRTWAVSARTEIDRLFRQVAFRCVVGDEDGHGKNYSLLLQDGEVTLAPLYDSLCTLAYPELTGHMGTRVGTQVNLARVDRAALLAEARAMGLTESEATASLDELAADLRVGVANLSDTQTSGWASEQVIEIIQGRIDRLDRGAPLGGDRVRTVATTAGTFDQATQARGRGAAGSPASSRTT